MKSFTKITKNSQPSFKDLLRTPATGKSDKVLLALVILITSYGVLMVYCASSYSALYHHKDSFFYLKKQLLGAILGGAAMAGMTFLNYRILDRLKYVLLIVSTVLLILVFIPGIGISNYGARRWIDLPGFTLQPSEISKFALIIFAAGYMHHNVHRMKTFLGLLPVLGAGAITAVLIILEPNMSITVCILGITLTMLFVGGARLKHFVIMSLPVAALLPILILIEPYRMNRLMAFLNPWASPQSEGFQLIQSYYSLGSGGLFGVGLFNSRQKYLFLPFSESDFIFSIIGEELGLFGAMMTIALFAAIIYRCVRVALNAPDRMGFYMASGVAAIIAIQVMVNIAVVTGSIPPTGLPLPFISAGSSSLVVFMSGIGIVQNIARNSPPRKEIY